MKSALLLLMGSTLFSSCAIVQSSSCRKAAQGDIPCQGLKGVDFQKCQLEVRRAVATCQAEQMHKSPDSVGVYRLPPPDPTPATAVIAPAPAPVVPVVVPEKKDTVKVEPPVAKPAPEVAPSAPIPTVADSQAVQPASPAAKVDSAPAPSPALESTIPVATEKLPDSLSAPKTDSTKSSATAGADSSVAIKGPVTVPQDSIASPAPKKSKKSKRSKKPSSENPSDSTAAPVVADAATSASVPVDSTAIAPVPAESVDTSSAGVTEPVKKKRHKKKS